MSTLSHETSDSVAASDEFPSAWDTELFVLDAAGPAALIARIESLLAYLAQHPDTVLADLASSLNLAPVREVSRLAIVAGSVIDLEQRLRRAAERLADPSCQQIKDASGIYYFAQPLYPQGKIALLFPGEGAQYPNMLGDLRAHFPEVRERLEWGAAVAHSAGDEASIYADNFGSFDESRSLGDVMCSVLLADWTLFELLSQLELRPNAVAGHSVGELAALWAAGCIDADISMIPEVRATMQRLQDDEVADQAETVLLAVGAAREVVGQAIEKIQQAAADGEVLVAMDNCPHQTVIVGHPTTVGRVEAELQARGLMYERLPFGRPYHTPQFEPFMGPLTRMFDDVAFRPAQTQAWSCTTSRPFPEDPAEIRRLAWLHWAAPVEFTRTIRAMHDDGARLFVEVGPRGNLTAFVDDILRGRAFLAVPANVSRRSGTTQLNHMAGQLMAHHVPLNLAPLYQHRETQSVDWESPMRNGTLLSDAVIDIQPPATQRGAVIAEYLGVMEQFLATQAEVVSQYFQGRHGGAIPNEFVISETELTESLELSEGPESFNHGPDDTSIAGPEYIDPPGPLVGEIISHEPGRELLVRRRLELAEDRYAAEHTVGGREVSHVDPEQHGLPVMPMTFSLEMMAENAALLAPGKVVLGLRNIQLLRWLAFDDGDPTTVEVSARVLDEQIPDAWPDATMQVAVSVRDLGNNSSLPTVGRGYAATGVVMLGDHLPDAPAAGEFQLGNRHPCRISLEATYRNLFHGPNFQGVTSLGAVGDEGIISQVCVLPRDELFASTDDPDFLLDPVLLDVGMHAVAAWHLEQPDQSGRILLPYECESVRVYGPKPPVGAELESRATITEDSQRQHTQSIDLVDRDGRLWCRLNAVKCWRFYLPFGDINFHGPKDQYFLGKNWPQALPPHAEASEPRAWCVRLEPPRDLLQAGMRLVTAHVTLPPAELNEFKRMQLPQDERTPWLFTRIAAKDAVRILWSKTHDQRLFPADILLEVQADGRCVASLRGQTRPSDFPHVALTHSKGVMAGLAAFSPHVGIALARVEPRDADGETSVFNAAERTLIDATDVAARDVTAVRFLAAKQAVAQALGQANVPDLQSLTIHTFDPMSGVVHIACAGVNVKLPELAGRKLVVQTWHEDDLIVATTVGEKVLT